MYAVNHSLALKKPVYTVKFKSPMIMNNEKVQGNSFIVSKGGEYIDSENMESISQLLLQAKQI